MSLRDALPEASVLESASKCEIQDVKGNKVDFGSIFAEQKTVVVFIRHFFCGEYVGQLAAVPQAALESAGTRIVVIGCGEWQPIENYADITEFQGAIYTDPSRKLYNTLGMDIQNLAKTPSGQKKPSYITMGAFTNIWQSLRTGPFKIPSLIGKQGNMAQLGGDFVLGPGNTCSFAHRMQHTEDHIEVVDLMKAAGVTMA
ncbi:AhpC/TSA antioxidant enzyme-domain-containing protein [Mycena maculata]|uniref:AhpC/TSA antioxidant enzyme-domain-containing protein n=1 Tax=Mycena maculata TaxID=230809 RepID=A0AAD7JUF3_9AGAR|nr:AhpC/TSA antioxidant enzyme-domain-containing protein [Mycena maculata]